MSNSAQHLLSIIPEVTYGVTPAVTPAFLIKPILGTTLGLSKGKIESKTIDPGRQVTDVRHGNRQLGGDINAELAYGVFDDLLEAVMCGTWAAISPPQPLVPGVTRRSFSVLRQFTDLGGGVSPFHLFKGVEFNSLKIDLKPEDFVNISFGCVGREVNYLTAAPSGATFTAPTANKSYDSFTGSILVDGLPVANVTALSLNIDNGMTPRFVVFSDLMNRPKASKFRVTGDLTLYFEDSDLLIAFNGSVKKSLTFTLTDLGGRDLIFTLPSVLPDGGQPDVNQEDDITISMPFSAIYEAGAPLPNALQIGRDPTP